MHVTKFFVKILQFGLEDLASKLIKSCIGCLYALF